MAHSYKHQVLKCLHKPKTAVPERTAAEGRNGLDDSPGDYSFTLNGKYQTEGLVPSSGKSW